MKLDDKAVGKLRLQGGKIDQIFFDDALRGFGFRVRCDGGDVRKSWIAQYRNAAGKVRRFKIGNCPPIGAAAARAKAQEVLARAQLGGDPQQEREQERAPAAGNGTLASTVKLYLAAKEHDLKEGRFRPSSLRLTRLYLLGDYFKPLHGKRIADIERVEVQQQLARIKVSNGTVTAGRCRAHLSAFFTWSMQEGLAERNAVIGTVDPDADRVSRERVLSDAELAEIWRACKDDEFGKMVKLLTLTGCRRQESHKRLMSAFGGKADMTANKIDVH
jgi:hypothetical protein